MNTDNLPTQADINEMDSDELLSKYIEQNRLWNTEGTQGVKNLETVCGAIGYQQGNYCGYGHELINFLSDNPGAITALYDWMTDHIADEQAENLRELIDFKEDEEDDED